MSSTKTKLPHRALSRQKIQEEQQDKMLFAFIMFFMFNLIASIGIAIMSRGESVIASIFGISNGKEHFMHMFDNIREYNQAKYTAMLARFILHSQLCFIVCMACS